MLTTSHATQNPTICLVLDNPLRDLDGLVLLAWHLAQRGADVWLVPMYEQGFDVDAIGADFVLLNYIRQNNRDHALHYLRHGIGVGVLDTEGMAGKSADQFAELVAKGGGASWMDLYCVWGKGQYQALLAHQLVAENRLKLTGCARYDYCSSPWRASLAKPEMEPGYILINTNFAGSNSRFAKSGEAEIGALTRGGYSEEFARDYIRDEREAHAAMMALIQTLVARFPHQQFVLRPHPFESAECYERTIQAPNFTVRQQGTSIEWINHARALIQLNCLTAIEAAAFGVPSFSPTWLNKPSLTVPLSVALSENMESEKALIEKLAQVIENSAVTTAKQQDDTITHYLLNDGKSCERITDAILSTLAQTRAARALPNSAPRFHALRLCRQMLGYKIFSAIQKTMLGASLENRRQRKHFSLEQVGATLQCIAHAAGASTPVAVHPMSACKLAKPRLASGRSICITARSEASCTVR